MKKENTTMALITDVTALHRNTPNGVIRDADTILADLLKNADIEVTGIAQEVFDIWTKSSDKKAVEDLFYCFTDTQFDSFLLKCKNEISK